MNNNGDGDKNDYDVFDDNNGDGDNEEVEQSTKKKQNKRKRQKNCWRRRQIWTGREWSIHLQHCRDCMTLK